jgi:ParB-like chromosome segregation protein Spo0J
MTLPDQYTQLREAIRACPEYTALPKDECKSVREFLRLLEDVDEGREPEAKSLTTMYGLALGEARRLRRAGRLPGLVLPEESTTEVPAPTTACTAKPEVTPRQEPSPRTLATLESFNRSAAPTDEPAAEGVTDAASPTATPIVQMVPISQIMRGEDVHTRFEIDEKTVANFVEALDAADPVPPGVVFFDGDAYWLSDGRHRIEAHARKGHDTFPAEVRPGGRRDAILHALSLDRNLARNDKDKKKAAKLLLQDPEWRQWSDREIARRTGASAPTVGKLRKELGLVTDERKSRDGKKRKVTKIGRKSKVNCKAFTVDDEAGGDTADTKPETGEDTSVNTKPATTKEDTSTPAAAQPTATQPNDTTTSADTSEDTTSPTTTATTTATSEDTGTTQPTTEHGSQTGDQASTTTRAADAKPAKQDSPKVAVNDAIRVVRQHLRKHPDDAAKVIDQLCQDAGLDMWLPSGKAREDIDDLSGRVRDLVSVLVGDDYEDANTWVKTFTDCLWDVVDRAAPESGDADVSEDGEGTGEPKRRKVRGILPPVPGLDGY